MTNDPQTLEAANVILATTVEALDTGNQNAKLGEAHCPHQEEEGPIEKTEMTDSVLIADHLIKTATVMTTEVIVTNLTEWEVVVMTEDQGHQDLLQGITVEMTDTNLQDLLGEADPDLVQETKVE